MTAAALDAARDALIAQQGQLIAMLAAQNAALAERVGELEERLARLERAASGNSGKQPGAPGSYLAWREDPDRTVPHFPRGACGCGANLAGAADLGWPPRTRSWRSRR